ncbi:MAG TPA: hypothetical protein VK911_13275 [Vicinamibacterales bacterium]|nr:hypothetical protein [Vicinamibacterales bacterium]
MSGHLRGTGGELGWRTAVGITITTVGIVTVSGVGLRVVAPWVG